MPSTSLLSAAPSLVPCDARTAREHKQYVADAVAAALATAPDEPELSSEGQEILRLLDLLCAVKVDDYCGGDTEAIFRAKTEVRLAPYLQLAEERLKLSRQDLVLLCPGREQSHIFQPFDEHCAATAIRWMVVSRHSPHLEIALEGSTAYRVPCTKPALKTFADAFRKGYGKWNEGGPKFGQTVRFGPTPVPPLVKKVTADVLADVISITVGTDETRGHLTVVHDTGKVSVASDGCRLTSEDSKKARAFSY